MNHTEFIMMDRATGELGRYQYAFDDEDELVQMIDSDMLLTMEEMVECTLNELSSRDMDDMAKLDHDQLIQLHDMAGDDIRAAYGLWLDCNPNVPMGAVNASLQVMELMWEELRNPTSVGGSQVMVFK